MAREIKLPPLGENVETADVVAVLVSVGDQVQKDQSLIEIETEKASAEIPAEATGVVKAIHVKVGDKITVGQNIVTIEGGEEGAEKAAAEKPAAEKGAAEKGASEEAPSENAAAAVEVGAERARPHPREEMAADKASQTPKSGSTPKAAQKTTGVAKPAPAEEPAPTGKAEQALKVAPAEKPAPAKKPAPEAAPEHQAAAAAPSVRELARELGVDIDLVPGSGPGGRVSAEDVQEYVRGIVPGAARPGGAPAGRRVAALPDFTKWGEVRREPMSNVRRKTAEHLAMAWSAIPHVTQFDQADITRLEKLRERYGERVTAAGGKLTITAIVLKVTAAALKIFPRFNSSLDSELEELIFKQYVHIGVAVDTDRGLLVPVIRDVDKKNLIQISVELTGAADRARNRKITLEELRGGCFSITNLGGLGTTYFSPIVNWPEVAVLGIGRARTEAVFMGGQFEPRLILPLSISYDHRVIDGADAARFLRWIAEALAQPMLLVLEG